MTWIPDAALDHLREVASCPDLAGTRYDIIEPLGEGGMGAVYLALDRQLDRQVALKVVKDVELAPDAAARLLREAQIIAKLEHPGIVPVHDVGHTPDGRTYYVMKRVRGRRLDEHFDALAPIVDRLRVFERICETVAFAHAHAVIHRDLKPQNVMVGEFGEVLVLDWGVSKALHPPDRNAAAATPGGPPSNAADDPLRTRTLATRHGAIIGTPAYMPPEQARGDVEHVDERSDVYALGAILYFLLTGQPPGPATGPDPPSPRKLNRGVSKPLDAISRTAMAADPARRYHSAGQLAADIADLRGGRPVRAYRESPLERVARITWAYRAPILLVAAYLLMRVALLFWPRR